MSDHRRILLVTSWATPCGVADHSAMLKAAVEAADPDLAIRPDSRALDPHACLYDTRVLPDLVHLNHHDALHAQWTVERVREVVQWLGGPVVVTYHDSRERMQDTPKLEQLAQIADAIVVHEPIDLQSHYPKLHYWRQGIPAPAQKPADYAVNHEGLIFQHVPEGEHVRSLRHLTPSFKAYPQQPVLGTVGFNFPWKNYDRLATETALAGWALVILSNNATEEDEQRWRASNPSLLVVRGFLDSPTIVNYLAGCDATAFMYECANTGTSGAIRQGIAARKPVIALKTCRQFRDLLWMDATEDLPGCDVVGAIRWAEDWNGFRRELGGIHPARFWAPNHALAEQESWTRLGGKYAGLYRRVLAAWEGRGPGASGER